EHSSELGINLIRLVLSQHKTKRRQLSLATIQQNSYDIKSMLEFVPSEMREVYKLGYGKAIKGYDWQTEIL
ncbi:hypothetical protein, partial [Colwellia sp. E2M01]|uniref:hypothetical protein n=1 Tax=Colwellia sp. E2M01 TaxID=2841561 RepID=UPI001C084D0C